MNTLILDLDHLIVRHFTDVDDVLINYKNHDKTRNLKVAVRSRNWKAILYYIQRDQRHKSTMDILYYAACEIGDLKMMNLFNTNYDGIFELKYLAKGRQYSLLDQYLKKINPKYLDRAFGIILLGLLINGDTDLILSNKYGDCNKFMNSLDNNDIIGDLIYQAYKYQRNNILDAFNLRNNNRFLLDSTRGKIRAGERPIISSSMFTYTEIRILTKYICMYGTDEYVDLYASLNIKNIDSTALDMSGRGHLVKKYVDRGFISHSKAVIAAIEADNVELFSSYYMHSEKLNYTDLIDNTIRNEAVCVLKFLLDTHPHKPILFVEHVGEGRLHITDYKIANMLKQEKLKGRKIQGYTELVDNTRRAGYKFFE